ncbi:tetratricopeptide repeat protein [Lentzea sp. NPDC006480]|uniref:ATP-binding protein n=1 Tax=Lentzea sp. NPDC006480 TaxID=3157176 RepID=UPI0033A84084
MTIIALALWPGLEAADKIGSVIGAFCGVVGIGISTYSLTLARQPPPEAPPNGSPKQLIQDPIIEIDRSTASGEITVTGDHNNVAGHNVGTVAQGALTATSIEGNVVQAGVLKGDVHLHPAAQRAPIPRQLPAAPASFVGRHEELAQLTAALDIAGNSTNTAMVSIIAGTGGIGKTWLTLHWARQNIQLFPDGQLFVDLRGFSPAADPMPTGAAVRGFLDAFDIAPERIPIELSAQVALYRSCIAEKRMLIVLDNARDTDQISSLLPGTSTCTVILTSRDQLPGMTTAHGAQRLTLGVLDEDEARAMLAERIGRERVGAEPAATAELLARCAGLPLALSIVASRATTHPEFSLEVLAGELRDTADRLTAFDQGDIGTNLTAVLSWSYSILPIKQAEVLCLISLAPGPDISLSAAVSLSGLSATQAQSMLRALEKMSLLEQRKPGRWQMHDLVRLYATKQADTTQSADQQNVAMRRLVDFYLHTAHAGDRLLTPGRPSINISEPTAGCRPQLLVDQSAALTWFDSEHSCLLATQRSTGSWGIPRAGWQMAWALDSFHRRRGHVHDHLTAWQVGLAAAQREGDPSALLLAHRLLGQVWARLDRYTEALDHLTMALTLAQEAKDLLAQANTHNALALAYGRKGEDEKALEHAVEGLHLFRTLHEPVLEAEQLNAAGWYLTRLGQYEQARAHCGAALTLCRRHNYREGEADTLDTLGYLAHHMKQYDEALDYYHRALTLFRELSYTYYEADILDRLGSTHSALGDHIQASHNWLQALQLYQNQDRTKDVERIQHQLDDLAG